MRTIIDSDITNNYSNIPTGAGVGRIAVGTATLNFDLTSVEQQDLTITVTGVTQEIISLLVPAVAAVANSVTACPGWARR